MDQDMGSDLAVRKVVVLIERLRIVAGLTLSGRDGFPDLVDVTGRTFELVLLRFRRRDSESVIAELPPKTGIFSIMMTFLRPRSSASFSTKVAAMPESTITVSHSSSRRTSETFFVTAGPPARAAPRKGRSPASVPGCFFGRGLGREARPGGKRAPGSRQNKRARSSASSRKKTCPTYVLRSDVCGDYGFFTNTESNPMKGFLSVVRPVT